MPRSNIEKIGHMSLTFGTLNFQSSVHSAIYARDLSKVMTPTLILRPGVNVIKLFSIQILEFLDFPKNGEISPKMEESG